MGYQAKADGNGKPFPTRGKPALTGSWIGHSYMRIIADNGLGAM